MKKIYLVFSLILLIFNSALATDLIVVDFDSAPSTENNGGIYTGSTSTVVIDTRNGTPADMFDHITGSDCWGGSGGCAKIWQNTTAVGSYRGFTPGSYSGGATQLNIRYLGRWNSDWDGSNNLKGNYLTLGGSPLWTQEKGMNASLGLNLQMAFSYNGTLYYAHGNGQLETTCDSGGYYCCPYKADCTLGTGVAAAGPFYFGDYNNEWVCFEIELHSAGTSKLYIWTQDSTFDGLYMSVTNNPTGTPAATGVGGTYFTGGNSAVGSYTMVDELIFADSYIGPPVGFTSGGSTPTLEGVTITGVSIQ